MLSGSAAVPPMPLEEIHADGRCALLLPNAVEFEYSA